MLEINDMVYLDFFLLFFFCVTLGKASTFSSSPRAEFLSFDFRYDVYPKAAVSDKKERANPSMGVRCCRVQCPFLLPTKLGQSKAPMKRCQHQFPPPAKSFMSQNVSLCRLSTCLLSFVEKDAASEGSSYCSELGVHSVPSLSDLGRWPREETWLGVSNRKPLILCRRNILLWVLSRNCHLVSLVAAFLGAAGAALLPVPSTSKGSPQTWG